jgi:hypothetical protein
MRPSNDSGPIASRLDLSLPGALERIWRAGNLTAGRLGLDRSRDAKSDDLFECKRCIVNPTAYAKTLTEPVLAALKVMC